MSIAVPDGAVTPDGYLVFDKGALFIGFFFEMAAAERMVEARREKFGAYMVPVKALDEIQPEVAE